MARNTKQTPTAAAAQTSTLITQTTPSGATITSAAPVQHIGATDTAALSQYGAAFAASFTSIDLNIAKVQGDASALALILSRVGAGESLETYRECRAAFIAGMVDRSAEAAERFWQRAYSAARDTAEGSKLPKGGPASAAPAAVEKAAQRAKAKQATAEDARTPAELLAAAAAASKASDFIGAGKLAKLAAQKTQAADRDAKAKAHEATKAQCDQIRAAVKRLSDAGNVAALAAILKLALKHSPEPVKAA
jgi:hypothetical protein